MPVQWTLGIVILIFKGKGDFRNCCCFRAMNFLEHGLKVLEGVLVKRFIE